MFRLVSRKPMGSTRTPGRPILAQQRPQLWSIPKGEFGDDEINVSRVVF
jgi:predicted NUDIX family NTP pyrophosphohydrolase